MSAAAFWAVAAAILLSLLGSCAIVISGSSGGIPELAYAGVPMLILGIAIFWRVVKRYPKPRKD
jgi:hypothetical protein